MVVEMEYATLSQLKELTETPDFVRAYELHGKFYDGEDVSADEQKFYDEFIMKLVDWDDNPDREYDLPFSIRMWLVYATAYVTGERKAYRR